MADKKVFISYSQDSNEHNNKVSDLATRLRNQDISVSIDKDIIFPEEGWVRWMKRQLEEADVTLIVCSEKYKNRFENNETKGVGKGAKFEGSIISQILYEEELINKARFIPIIFDEKNEAFIPQILTPYTYFKIPKDFKILCSLIKGVQNNSTKVNVTTDYISLCKEELIFEEFCRDVQEKHDFKKSTVRNIKNGIIDYDIVIEVLKDLALNFTQNDLVLLFQFCLLINDIVKIPDIIYKTLINRGLKKDEINGEMVQIPSNASQYLCKIVFDSINYDTSTSSVLLASRSISFSKYCSNIAYEELNEYINHFLNMKNVGNVELYDILTIYKTLLLDDSNSIGNTSFIYRMKEVVINLDKRNIENQLLHECKAILREKGYY